VVLSLRREGGQQLEEAVALLDSIKDELIHGEPLGSVNFQRLVIGENILKYFILLSSVSPGRQGWLMK
jgi:hypothetical protein